MGLDMYLSKKTYVKRWDHHKPEDQFTITVKRGGKKFPAIKPERVAYVTEEVASWRKANAIHAWFVANVQDGTDDCRNAYVEREKLEALRDLCREILNAPEAERRALAGEKLPPQAGFFFGSIDVDEGYIEDLTYTAETLDALLAEEEPGKATGEYKYHSSW